MQESKEVSLNVIRNFPIIIYIEFVCHVDLIDNGVSTTKKFLSQYRKRSSEYFLWLSTSLCVVVCRDLSDTLKRISNCHPIEMDEKNTEKKNKLEIKAKQSFSLKLSIDRLWFLCVQNDVLVESELLSVQLYLNCSIICVEH